MRRQKCPVVRYPEGRESTESDQVSIQIDSGPAHAYFSMDHAYVGPDTAVHFDATDSHIDGQHILDYEWNFGGTIVSGPDATVSHKFTKYSSTE